MLTDDGINGDTITVPAIDLIGVSLWFNRQWID